MKKLSGLSVAIMLAVGSGCANLASFQTPDVEPVGTGRMGLGLTYSNYRPSAGEVAINVPAINFWYRRGIANNFEVHVNAWLPLGVSGGVKYQLIRVEDTGFEFSIGGDLGYIELTTTSGSTSTSVNVLDFYAPVYLGYQFSPSVSLYLSPKYILRTSFGDTVSFGHMLGSTLGVALGERSQFMIEGTYAQDLEANLPIFTGGVGMTF